MAIQEKQRVLEFSFNTENSDYQCDIIYDDKCIMTGFKDKTTDLWKLPTQAIQQQPTNKQLKQRVKLQATHQPTNADTAHAASFAHSVRRRALKVRFAH